MWQIEHLQTLTRPRAPRSTRLIIDAIDPENAHIEAPEWTYPPTYAHRSALDIQLLPRQRDKETVYLWTQGAMLAFALGDIFHSADRASCLAVEYAEPVKRTAEGIHFGDVSYQSYRIIDGSYTKSEYHSCTQLDFLAILIRG